MKPAELLALSAADRADYLDALDWWIEQVDGAQSTPKSRREGM